MGYRPSHEKQRAKENEKRKQSHIRHSTDSVELQKGEPLPNVTGSRRQRQILAAKAVRYITCAQQHHVRSVQNAAWNILRPINDTVDDANPKTPNHARFLRNTKHSSLIKPLKTLEQDLDPRLLYNVQHTTIVFAPIFLIELGGFSVRRRVWIGIREQRLDGGQDGGDIVDRAPLILKNVQADLTGCVNCKWSSEQCIRKHTAAETHSVSERKNRANTAATPTRTSGIVLLGWNILDTNLTCGGLLG